MHSYVYIVFNDTYSLIFGHLDTTLNRMELKWRNNVIRRTRNVDRGHQSRILPSIPLITLFRCGRHPKYNHPPTTRNPTNAPRILDEQLSGSILIPPRSIPYTFTDKSVPRSPLPCFPFPLLSSCHFNPFEGDELVRGFFFLLLSTVGEDNKRHFLLLDYTSRRIDVSSFKCISDWRVEWFFFFFSFFSMGKMIAIFLRIERGRKRTVP